MTDYNVRNIAYFLSRPYRRCAAGQGVSEEGAGGVDTRSKCHCTISVSCKGKRMLYIEAPSEQSWPDGMRSLFLAGGITGCPDWQSDVVSQLRDTPLVLFNPRRADFPMHNSSAAERQIKWEFDHLRLASFILFWFPCETLNPIVLYELGAWSMTSKPLFVGAHPDYQRRQDVVLQTRLARPDVRVEHNIHDLVASVKRISDIST